MSAFLQQMLKLRNRKYILTAAELAADLHFPALGDESAELLLPEADQHALQTGPAAVTVVDGLPTARDLHLHALQHPAEHGFGIFLLLEHLRNGRDLPQAQAARSSHRKQRA